MSWAILDVVSAQVSTSNTLQLPAFGPVVQADDLIFLHAANWNSGQRDILGPTDTAGGNTYVASRGTNLMASSVGMKGYFNIVTNGGSSFRVTVNSTSTTAELTGIAWLCRWDAPGTPTFNGDYVEALNAASANPASGTSTPAPAANSIFFGGMGLNGTQAVTDGSGWNSIANGFDSTMNAAAKQTNNTPHQCGYSEYQISSAALNAQWTSTSDSWAAYVWSFAPPTVVVADEIYQPIVPTQRML